MEQRLEVDIQVIVHATEDLEKILGAFDETFGVGRDEFESQSLTGHFENPITLLHSKIKKKKARAFVAKMIASMPKEQVDSVIQDLENRYDDSTLHLRISKQDLIRGKVTLSDREPVKVKIFTPIYKRAEFVDTFTAILKGTN